MDEPDELDELPDDELANVVRAFVPFCPRHHVSAPLCLYLYVSISVLHL